MCWFKRSRLLDCFPGKVLAGPGEQQVQGSELLILSDCLKQQEEATIQCPPKTLPPLQVEELGPSEQAGLCHILMLCSSFYSLLYHFVIIVCNVLTPPSATIPWPSLGMSHGRWSAMMSQAGRPFMPVAQAVSGDGGGVRR